MLIDGRAGIVQIGANDGLLADPVHDVIVELDLPAILVEPLPDVFEKLVHNYAGQPNVHFENCAISLESGETTIFRVNRGTKQLPEWVHGLASFEKSTILKHRDAVPDLKEMIEPVRVPVLTMAQLLSRHAEVARFLALQIDTEGHDFIVVKSALAAGLLPRIINYEHKHLSYTDQAACRELLSTHQYSFCSSDTDALAYRM